MKRAISHSEIQTAYECQARHAFAYTGHLTEGVTLKPLTSLPRLRAGRAWGRAVAAYHQTSTTLHLNARYIAGLRELHSSLEEDADEMRDRGLVYDVDEHADMEFRLAEILWHYAQTTTPLHITNPEFEIRLPIPSRTGRRASNRYVFEGKLDGLADEDDRLWVVEYKMRDSLSDLEMVARGRQYRRYVWAAEQQLDRRIAGIIVDERLSDAPKPARWVKAKRKGEGIDGKVPSHAKDQLTTPLLYVEACAEAGVDPDVETYAALKARAWQTRHRVVFKRSEIEEAGRELVSAGQLIHQLDTGLLHPVRNPAPWRCRGCAFREPCVDPQDRELIEANFEVTVPKRDREPLETAA